MRVSLFVEPDWRLQKGPRMDLLYHKQRNIQGGWGTSEAGEHRGIIIKHVSRRRNGTPRTNGETGWSLMSMTAWNGLFNQGFSLGLDRASAAFNFGIRCHAMPMQFDIGPFYGPPAQTIPAPVATTPHGHSYTYNIPIQFALNFLTFWFAPFCSENRKRENVWACEKN